MSGSLFFYFGQSELTCCEYLSKIRLANVSKRANTLDMEPHLREDSNMFDRELYRKEHEEIYSVYRTKYADRKAF